MARRARDRCAAPANVRVAPGPDDGKLCTVVLPRDATDAHLERKGIRLDIVFDVDLGELVRGHHVIVRGIDRGHEVPVPRWIQERTERLGQGVDQIVDEAAPSHGFSRRSDRDMEIVGTRLTEAELHYEFVPGLEAHETVEDPFFWYWMLDVSDDVGTFYQDSNGGTRGPSLGGPATHATRDLGGVIPESAVRLLLRFIPPSGWDPPEPWRRELSVDLETNGFLEAR
jgi:hypothetical protein